MFTFKEGASVYTANGDQVGSVDRVVLDPRTKQVTHLVVRKGFLFKEDRVLPIDWVASSNEDRILLRPGIAELEQLPLFEEQDYVPVSETDLDQNAWPRPYAMTPMYWYPGVGAAPMFGTSFTGVLTPAYESGYTARTEQNIPDETIALKGGAKVITSDGEHVGDLDQVVTRSDEEQATHFVISHGLLVKDKKLVPANWVDHIEEDEVHLGVSSNQIERLPTLDS